MNYKQKEYLVIRMSGNLNLTIKILLFFFGLSIFLNCKKHTQNPQPEVPENKVDLSENLFIKITEDSLAGFKWLNTPKSYEIDKDYLLVTATGNTDFFINPVDLSSSDSAPFFYREISGDFVAITKVSPDLSLKWNAATFMVIIDPDNWIKFGFENSDATGPSIVSVVTRGTSDDANGVILENTTSVWLKLIRKDNNYAMHWSLDGVKYHMARLAAMRTTDTVKLGLEAQCPVGEKAVHKFEYLNIKSETVEDLRAGN